VTVGSGITPDLLTFPPEIGLPKSDLPDIGWEALAGLSDHPALQASPHHRRWGVSPRPENVWKGD